MKKIFSLILLVVSLVMVVSPPASAQTTINLINQKAYTNSQTDTTRAFNLGTYLRADVSLRAFDSVSITKIYIDIKPHNAPLSGDKILNGSSAQFWSLQDSLVAFSDTVRYADGGTWKVWSLRSSTVDKIPYVDVVARFRIVFAGSANAGWTAGLIYNLNLNAK